MVHIPSSRLPSRSPISHVQPARLRLRLRHRHPASWMGFYSDNDSYLEFDEDSHEVGIFKTLLFSEKEVTVFGCRNPEEIHGMRRVPSWLLIPPVFSLTRKWLQLVLEAEADGPAKKVRGGDIHRDLCA